MNFRIIYIFLNKILDTWKGVWNDRVGILYYFIQLLIQIYYYERKMYQIYIY